MLGEVPAWKQILFDCGYPTDILVLDFETYFDDVLTMDDMSTVEYVTHLDFEILGIATLNVTTDFPDYENMTAFYAEREANRILKYYQDQYGLNFETVTICGHNLYFDGLILARHFGIHPCYMIDTLGLARAWNSRTKNDLDTLAKRYKLPLKGDTSEFKGLSFRKRYTRPKKKRGMGSRYPTPVPVCTAGQLNRFSSYATNDVRREWELFTLLLPRLSSIRTELLLLHHTLRLFHSPTLEIDYVKAGEIKQAMQGEVDKSLFELGVDKDMICGTNTFKALLGSALEKAGDVLSRYLKPGKLGDNLAIAKTDEERELLLNHADDNVRRLMHAKVAIKSWPTHISRIDSMVAQARAMNGKFPVALKYHGAHTGRFSGDEGINPQNLGNRGHELVNAVRTIIVAPSGHSLWIADAAQIEARVLAWIAGQEDAVAKWRNNEDIYCEFASKVLQKTIRKAKKSGGIPTIESYFKWARDSIGKVGILGCGYGMGATKAVGYAQGAIDLPTAEQIVATYRKENPKITQFWRDIEKAFIYTYKYDKACELPRGLRFDKGEDCDIILTLPSGREIHYHRVKIENGNYGNEAITVWNGFSHCWEHTWGGALTENVVQAMSRDILTGAMLRCEERGYHVALHVHDELVGVSLDADVEAGLKCGIEELARPPLWALDCPLGAEGHVSKHYGK